jgi:energy-coupling factor transporter transmembrane protein EcfT
VLILAVIPLLREDRKARLLAILLLLFAFAPFSIIWWLQLHYLAPAAAVAACLVMLLVRRLFIASPILGVAVLALFFANAGVTWFSWIGTPEDGFEPRRQQIAQSLVAQGGRHLVIVAPDVFDAVYNGADLERAPIVWARDLGNDANARLRAHYRDRSVWLLEKSGIRRY